MNLCPFFTGQDQVQRAPRQEQGWADQAAQRAEDGVGQLEGCPRDRRSSFQALQDPRGEEVHRQGLYRHAPEAEGEPQEALQGKKKFIYTT